jgi:V/A-type H+-transporting ATPase subunit D
MAKIKLTKNELKKQKDALKMYQRYLPTLMLKKQQLQAEIRITEVRIRELLREKERIDGSFKSWIGVFGEKGFFTPRTLRITNLKTATGNIAGVSIPLFQGAEFSTEHYDLARTPLWLDLAVEKMKQALLLDLEAMILEEQRKRLDHELRVTTQRVIFLRKLRSPKRGETSKRSRFI